MSTRKLFVSFWSICLTNLPEGAFRRRRIEPDDARLCIDEARRENMLLCVSDADLGAPYKEREAKNHEALCRVLSSHFGIMLSLKDFFSAHDSDGDTLHFVNPLNCLYIQGDSRLLVINCTYVLRENAGARPAALDMFDIDPATVEFNIIESM